MTEIIIQNEMSFQQILDISKFDPNDIWKPVPLIEVNDLGQFQRCSYSILQWNLSRGCLRSLDLELKMEQKSSVLNSKVYNAGKKVCDMDWFLNLQFFQLKGFYFLSISMLTKWFFNIKEILSLIQTSKKNILINYSYQCFY